MSKRTEQRPAAPFVMKVDQILLSRATVDDSWELWAYAKDQHGRSWMAPINLSEPPHLLVGERVFEHEMIEVEE